MWRPPARARAGAPGEDEPAEDEPITLKSVETVSAIDLVMGGAPRRMTPRSRIRTPSRPPRPRTHFAMPTLVGSRWQRSEHPKSR